jgi:hypothetical protein
MRAIPAFRKKPACSLQKIPCNRRTISLQFDQKFPATHFREFQLYPYKSVACGQNVQPPACLNLVIAGNFASLRGAKGRKRPANARLL